MASQISLPSHISTGGGVAMGFVFGLLIFTGLTGNTLVCVAICANKELKKNENLYFVSLAVADLLLCILVMPFAAYNDIAGFWPFGEYCKIWMSLDIMCCTASILHLCAISFDRCYHIHTPMQYTRKMTTSRIMAAILLVWALSAAIAFAPLAFETHFNRALSIHVQIRANRTYIAVHSCNFNLEPTYAIISSMVSFYIPSCVMIIAYTKLYKYARKHARTIRHQLKAATTFLMHVASTAPETTKSQSRKWPSFKSHTSVLATKRREMGASDSKARITLGVILGSFIFSWGPFFVCNIVKSFCGNICVPHALFAALTWMGYANSAQNPIIYSIFNRNFRRAFGKILFCGNGRRKRHSTVSKSELMINKNKTRDNRQEEKS